MGDEGGKEDGAGGWGWHSWIDVGGADGSWEIVISSDGGGQGQVGLGRTVRDVGVGPGHMYKAAESGRPGAGMEWSRKLLGGGGVEGGRAGLGREAEGKG